VAGAAGGTELVGSYGSSGGRRPVAYVLPAHSLVSNFEQTPRNSFVMLLTLGQRKELSSP
jgi:hypothetical protein